MHQFDVSKSVFTVSDPMDTIQRLGLCHIPLNLLAFIISYVEDVDDLARLCQTSRLLHYMTTPQLYKRITLTSYDTIRYRDDTPEGFGSASPFSVGLNALVTRNIANLVQELTLQGEWREHDLEACSRAGRVPDGSMMLNIAVRAAIDRCTHLASFSWKLNVRLMPTVYSALGALNTLEKFHLRCPSKRTPQPVATIPPLPNLREFVMTDYDPLCHPDDLSTMFVSATKLEALTMHFSPRMRDSAEPSVQLHSIFRRNVAAKQRMSLKRLEIYNCFAMAVPELQVVFTPDVVEEMTMINSFGPSNDTRSTTATHFVDQSWVREHPPDKSHSRMKSMRVDRVLDMVKDLSVMTGLEKLYIVNGNKKKACDGAIPSPMSMNSSSEEITPAGVLAELKRPTSVPSSPGMTPTEILRDNLIEAICKHHGSTIKHLIIPSRLPLSHFAFSQLIRSCPNLTQLCFAPEEIDPEILKHVLPSASNLKALHLTAPDAPGKVGVDRRKAFLDFEARNDHEYYINLNSARILATGTSMAHFRYIGIGHKTWEIGQLQEEIQMIQDEFGNEVEQVVTLRKSKSIGWSDVADIEVWKYDTMDLV